MSITLPQVTEYQGHGPPATCSKLGMPTRSERAVLLVTTSFDGAVIATHYLDGQRGRRSLWVGSVPGVDVTCSCALLPSPRHALVRWQDGKPVIALPDTLTGNYREPGLVCVLPALRQRGLLIPAEGEPGIALLDLPAEGELQLDLGPLVVEIRRVEAAPRLPPGRLLEEALLTPTAALALLASLLVALIAMLPPEPQPLRGVDESTRARLGRLAFRLPRPVGPSPAWRPGRVGATEAAGVAGLTSTPGSTAHPHRGQERRTRARLAGPASARLGATPQPGPSALVSPRQLLAALIEGPILGSAAATALAAVGPEPALEGGGTLGNDLAGAHRVGDGEVSIPGSLLWPGSSGI